MRVLAIGALLYGVVAVGANGVAAAPAAGLAAADRAALEALRQGDMKKLVVHEAALPLVAVRFHDGEGAEIGFADFAGKVVLVNLWATWCAPCRKEMPGLDRLAGEMAGEDLALVALSTDRAGPDRIEEFYEEIGVGNLAIYQDRRSEVMRAAGVLGLPVTLVLDREGREIARLTGEAEWDGPEARALLGRLIELTAPGS